MKKSFLILFCVSLCSCTLFSWQKSEQSEIRIAFGSCIADPETSLWDEILQQQPDALLLLGDNVYFSKTDFREGKAGLLKKYNLVYTSPLLQKLIQSIPVYPIWDDHDSGLDNTTKNFPALRIAKKAFFEFWSQVSPDLDERGEILYRVVRFPGVDILLTDNRSYRDIPGKSDAAFFGTAQMEWLEKNLKENPENIKIIASGNQLLGSGGKHEGLHHYPEEQQKFIKLLGKAEARVVVISGDLHYGQILSRKINGKEILEVTSSPLAAPVATEKDIFDDPNRKGEVVRKQNFGFLKIKKEGTDSPIISFQLINKSFRRVVVR